MKETSPWSVTVLTLFPEMFPGPLGYSILGRGLEQKLWSLQTKNLRDYGIDKHRTVDDIAFGGGPGMVLRPDVIDNCLKEIVKSQGYPDTFIYLSPRGQPFTQRRAKRLANDKKTVMLCGRFEGVDQRALEAWNFEELSLGDFILAGGEVAAMTVIEACVRLLPGILGAAESLDEESFTSGLLEYPQYTRPRCWQGREVPSVLVTGHHQKIQQWRTAQAEAITQQRRPDLWQVYMAQKRLTGQKE